MDPGRTRGPTDQGRAGRGGEPDGAEVRRPRATPLIWRIHRLTGVRMKEKQMESKLVEPKGWREVHGETRVMPDQGKARETGFHGWDFSPLRPL